MNFVIILVLALIWVKRNFGGVKPKGYVRLWHFATFAALQRIGRYWHLASFAACPRFGRYRMHSGH
jgi:hypothetical protein